MKRQPLPESDPARLDALRGRVHPRCIVCGAGNPMGLGLHFTVAEDGAVESTFAGSEVFEGYTGRLHGGLIAALLDGAMTNCLFAHGCEAVTAELTVRYRHPVAPTTRMTLRAWLTESHEPLHLLRAELRQGEQVKAVASGKFLQSHE
jgi:uncharacterized protein (TIGR00369 family)